MMNAKESTFYDIFILHPASEELKHKELDKIPSFYSNCRIQYIAVDDTFAQAYEIRGITTPAYYRLLIPELIPQYDKVLYSDVDVIFRTDLSLLYATDLFDNYIAATYDLGLCLSNDGREYIESIKGLVKGDYIQSGFLIINSRIIRDKGVVEKFKEASKQKLRYQDQDILNLVCRGCIFIIPFLYNMTDQLFYYMDTEPQRIKGKYDNADMVEAHKKGTIHFNGFKPWKGWCVNFDIWWEYYRKSPFYDEKFYFDFFYNKLDEYDRLSFYRKEIANNYVAFHSRNGG